MGWESNAQEILGPTVGSKEYERCWVCYEFSDVQGFEETDGSQICSNCLLRARGIDWKNFIPF